MLDQWAKITAISAALVIIAAAIVTPSVGAIFWLAQLDSDVNHLQGDVTQLQGDVTQLQGDVTRLRGDFTQLQGDVTQLQGDVTRLRGDFTQLQGDVTQLKSNVQQLQEGQQTILDYLQRLENNGLANKAEPETATTTPTGGQLPLSTR